MSPWSEGILGRRCDVTSKKQDEGIQPIRQYSITPTLSDAKLFLEVRISAEVFWLGCVMVEGLGLGQLLSQCSIGI